MAHHSKKKKGFEESLITNEILQTAIGSKTGNIGVTVSDVRVSPVSEHVRNYISDMYTVTLNATTNDSRSYHELVVKTVTDNKERKQWTLSRLRVFHTEAQMYKEVIPTMERMQRKKCGSRFGLSVPEHYHSLVNDEMAIVILQNYQLSGYTVLDTHRAVDYEHCKLVMKEIAAFHALSWALKNEGMDNIEKYPFLFRYYFAEDSFSPFKDNALQKFIDLVTEKHPDTRMKEAATKLSTIDLEQTMKRISKPCEPYAVICHGDLHICNMLFKHHDKDSNKAPEKLKLIDFQVAFYGSPTTDLAMFFYSSTTRTTRKLHLEELLHIYHDEFHSCLKRLDISFPAFSFGVLKDMFAQSALLGMITSCAYLPFLLCSRTDLKSFSKEGKSLLQSLPQLCDRCPVIQERLFENLADIVEIGCL